jgi:hypothetical protein
MATTASIYAIHGISQIGSARSVMNERRQELEAAARSSIRDEEDRNAVFELTCFTPQIFVAHGCKAGARVCLLLADGRPARLPPGAFPRNDRLQKRKTVSFARSQFIISTRRGMVTITRFINRPLLDHQVP